MIKSVKLGLGITLAIGLSACNMMGMQRPEHQDIRYVPMDSSQKKMAATDQAIKHKPVQKSYASKDPVQKSTPGPARKAAPQLPVIE